MERSEWLKQMREIAEALYDHIAPEYWVSFGFYANETHLEYLQKFLDRVAPHSALLSAACGAGRYDGILLGAGHSVTGTDQSEGMLRRAREHFPEVRYEKIALQEMNFHETFDGAICMDALEHVCPEDWLGILERFAAALKPGGVLYFTVEVPDMEELETSYQRAKEMGLPLVFGEVADGVETSYRQVKALNSPEVSGTQSDVAVYHYHPTLEQVRTWIEQADLVLEEQGTGNGYYHLLIRKM